MVDNMGRKIDGWIDGRTDGWILGTLTIARSSGRVPSISKASSSTFCLPKKPGRSADPRSWWARQQLYKGKLAIAEQRNGCSVSCLVSCLNALWVSCVTLMSPLTPLGNYWYCRFFPWGPALAVQPVHLLSVAETCKVVGKAHRLCRATIALKIMMYLPYKLS